MSAPKLGWSDFARARNVPGYSHWLGTEEALLDLVRAHWDRRTPGTGRTGLDEVVVVPVPPEGFVSGSVRITDDMPLSAEPHRRQPHEDLHVRVRSAGPAEPARFAKLVLYSKDTLLENDGTRSGDYDWEVVAIIASPIADEPMHPLTMARNMLAKPGGTPVDYSARQFAEAVYYWSMRVKHQP